MRILSVTINNYKNFTNPYQVFFEGDSFVSYLVGNNGSGKTTILDAIRFLGKTFEIKNNFVFLYRIELNQSEMLSFNLRSNLIEYEISRTESKKINYKIIADGKTIINHVNILEDKVKFVYSTPEVYNHSYPLNGVTTTSVDSQLTPKQFSNNLSQEIPQLLVDIQTQDAREYESWSKKNPSKTYSEKPALVAERMLRFEKSYNEMFFGTKSFSEVKLVDGFIQLLFKNQQGEEIELDSLSTGEKQVVYRIGYLLREVNNLEGGFILIDEPELSLHPQWQIRFPKLLRNIFEGVNVQIFIATHSPYIIQNFLNDGDSCVVVGCKKSVSTIVKENLPSDLVFSPNLASYFAFGVLSVSLFDELYSVLLRKKRLGVKKMESHILSDYTHIETKTFVRTVGVPEGPIGAHVTESIITYVRNSFHHPEEKNREVSDDDIEKAVKCILELLK